MSVAAVVEPLAEVPIAPLPDVSKVEVEIKTEKVAEEKSLPFDPAALKDRYIAERDKRLQRGQGVEQYIVLDGHLSHYLTDPWVEPGFTRAPVDEEVDVVIIGGGYGAQVVAVRLLEAGVTNFRIVEKASDFGGTWYWNRYPGAQCDIESYIYMPLLEEVGYMPTEKYARAKELLAHSRMIGEKFGLYERTLFQTEVQSLRWNEETGRWLTSTSRSDSIKSRFVIPAAGPLHRPKLPGLRGIEDFKGHSFHSSRWDFKYTGGDPAGGLEKLKDKRIGMIGTGATAVQIVPHLGEWAKELYVFQRTPSSIDVRGNKPTDASWAAKQEKGWQQKRMDNFDSVVNGGIEPEDMVADGWTDIIRELITKKLPADLTPVEAAAERQLADFRKMEQVRARADSLVQDKTTADSLKPWYNQFCKRPCFHDEYLQSFNRPSVHLIDTKGNGVDRITEKGIVANGQEYEIDCLIYATGFEIATDWTHRTGFEIYGRDGLTITEKWRDGASTLHGWSSRGFPNCFFVSVVQAALTPNFMHVTGEQAKHFAYIISECSKRNIRTVEPTAEAEKEWCDTIVAATAIRAEFFKECTPGYYNNEGKPSMTAARNATYGGGSPAFLRILKDWRKAGELKGLDVRLFEEKKVEDTDIEHKEAANPILVPNGEKKALENDKPEHIETVSALPVQNGVKTTESDEKVYKDIVDQTTTNQTVGPVFPANLVSPTGNDRSLVKKYSDLHAKHQSEFNDLLSQQRLEVERFLKREAKGSGNLAPNGLNEVH